MAEETTTTEPTEAPPPEPAPAAPAEATPPPAEAQTTDTPPPADHQIPKSRFDEVNSKLKEATKRLAELEKAQTEAEKEREAAAQKALEDEGKWKELFETERAKLEKLEAKRQQAEAEAKEARLDVIRLKVATELKLPVGLADRLKGETEEEIKADALSILEMLPKSAPVITETDAARGANSQAPTPQKTDMEIQLEAAQLGVEVSALKDYYKQQQH